MQPGVYNLGDQRLMMKPFVDIAGSGIEGTYVFGNGHDLQANGIHDGLTHAAGQVSCIAVRDADLPACLPSSPRNARACRPTATPAM